MDKYLNMVFAFLKRREIAALCVIAVLAVLIYLPCFSYPFVSDDVYRVQTNQALDLPAFFRFSYFIDKNSSASAQNITLDVYRPLNTLVFSFTKDIFGLNPAAFRAVSMAMHIANTGFVLFIALLLGLNFRGSCFAAAFFAFNQTSAENLTNVTGQSSLMACLFFLWALFLFLKYAKEPSKKVVLICFLYFCAMASRETAVVLPGVLFAFNWFLFRDKIDKKFYISLIAVGVFFIFLRSFILRHASAGELWYYNVYLHGGMFLKYLLFEVPLAVFAPFLNHPLYHAVTLGANPYMQASLFVLLFSAAAVCVFVFRRNINPLFYVFAAWAFFTLLPVHNVPAADRFLYFALVPFSLALAFIFKNPSSIKTAAAAAYLLVMGCSSFAQGLLWKDTAYFINRAAQRYPNDYITLVNYGRMQAKAQDSFSAYDKAIAQHPPTNQLVRILFDKGSLKIISGDYEDAKHNFDEIIKIDDGVWYAYLGLYYYYMKTGDKEKTNEYAQLTVDKAVKNTRVKITSVPMSSGSRFLIVDSVIAAAVFVNEKPSRENQLQNQ